MEIKSSDTGSTVLYPYLEFDWGVPKGRGQKSRTRKKTNSWERRFSGTFRPMFPRFCLFSLSFQWKEGQKVPRNFVPGNFFFLILGGFSPSEKGPPVHGSRSYRETTMQNESCQMGGHEVTGRVTHQHPNLPRNFVTHELLDPSACPYHVICPQNQLGGGQTCNN